MPSEYNLVNKYLTSDELLETRRGALQRGSFEIGDAGVDDLWASFADDSAAKSSYFDYFFTGEDMRVHLGGIGDDPEFKNMPIANMGFSVEQEKAPVYGFWSRTYDAVMRGTRLIQGQFTIYSRDPDYMKRALAKAAQNRTRQSVDEYPAPESWREDARNMERYWTQNLDPAAIAQGASIWSAHPPFNLVVVYGVQSGSVGLSGFDDALTPFDDDNALYYDTNQRLVEGDMPASRFILEGCEITNMQQQISSGAFVAESYSFFARDIVVPSATRITRSSTPAAPAVNSPSGTVPDNVR